MGQNGEIDNDQGLHMKISGVVHFQGLNSLGINLLREFQRSDSDVRITFSADLSGAKAECSTVNSLSRLSRLAVSVESCG